MIPRGVLDIDEWTLLRTAWQSCFQRIPVESTLAEIESRWDPDRSVLVSQSVRSGLDLVLTALKWPAGSEILISAVTIPDMPRIIAEHGLVPVPIDVCQQSLAPDVEQLRSRLTSRTRAILIAHLFGSRLSLIDISSFARQHGLALWEDVAQGFALDRFPGDPCADISFFSFGLIKTQTALGGGILRFLDPPLAARCRELQAAWPRQTSNAFRKKIYRALLLRFLGRQSVMTTISQFGHWVGSDPDEWLSRAVRGFDPAKFISQLRQGPSRELIQLLHDRLASGSCRSVDQKAEIARRYSELLPNHVLIGADAHFPVRWVYPIASLDPDGLRRELRRQGYDATRRASALRVTPAPEPSSVGMTPAADRWVSQMIFLPLHPALRPSDCERIAKTVAERESEEYSDATTKVRP